jgi:hypothetical protein
MIKKTLSPRKKQSDRIIFKITKTKQVHIKKATPMDLVYLESLQSTLNEWNSTNDEEDYNDL